MRRTVLTTVLAVMSITSVCLATETNVTNENHSTELAAFKTSPFCMAIVKGDVEIVKKLIELGSDVNERSEGMTPLMYAARYNRTEIIKVLLEKGANVKAKDSKGYTALKFAKLSNAKEAIVLLKELS